MEMLWYNLAAGIVWGIIVYFWYVKKEGKIEAAQKAVVIGVLTFAFMMIIDIWGWMVFLVVAICIVGLVSLIH